MICKIPIRIYGAIFSTHSYMRLIDFKPYSWWNLGIYPFVWFWRISENTFHLIILFILYYISRPSRQLIFMFSISKNYLSFHLFTMLRKSFSRWHKDSSAAIFILLPPELVTVPIVKITKER